MKQKTKKRSRPAPNIVERTIIVVPTARFKYTVRTRSKYRLTRAHRRDVHRILRFNVVTYRRRETTVEPVLFVFGFRICKNGFEQQQ